MTRTNRKIDFNAFDAMFKQLEGYRAEFDMKTTDIDICKAVCDAMECDLFKAKAKSGTKWSIDDYRAQCRVTKDVYKFVKQNGHISITNTNCKNVGQTF